MGKELAVREATWDEIKMVGGSWWEEFVKALLDRGGRSLSKTYDDWAFEACEL